MSAFFTDLFEIGVANRLLSFATFFVFAFIMYFLMYKLLPSRLNIFGIVAIAVVFSLWNNLRSVAFSGANYHLWMNIFINAFTQFIILFLFKGKIWKKYIVWWYFELLRVMCEAVAYVPTAYIETININTITMQSNPGLRLLFLAVFISLFSLIGSLSVKIWRNILMRRFHPYYIFFIALPMGQRYALSRIMRPSMGDWFFGILINFVERETAYDMLSIAGTITCLVASAAMLYYVTANEKKAAIEAELLEARREMELKQARYSETAMRSEELAMIRHDFNNQLASIVQLVRAGEDGTARDIISALTNEINPQIQPASDGFNE